MKLLQLASIIAVLVTNYVSVSALPNYLARGNYHQRRSDGHVNLRGIFSCKEMGESCRGLPKCCGDLTCYWEDGYSVRTPGVCVTCINVDQMCQRDAQCCTDLVCQKASMYDVNGRCSGKLPWGAECHDNDQCETEHWHQDIQGHGGHCGNSTSLV